MNNFWKALVEFQYRDVLVVAICADSEASCIRSVAARHVRYCPKADKLLRCRECPLCANRRHRAFGLK